MSDQQKTINIAYNAVDKFSTRLNESLAQMKALNKELHTAQKKQHSGSIHAFKFVKNLGRTISEVRSVATYVVMPTLGILGLGVASIGVIIAGVISRLGSLGEASFKLDIISQRSGIAVTQLKKYEALAAQSGIDKDAMLEGIAGAGEFFQKFKEGALDVQAAVDSSGAGGNQIREVLNAINSFPPAERIDRFFQYLVNESYDPYIKRKLLALFGNLPSELAYMRKDELDKRMEFAEKFAKSFEVDPEKARMARLAFVRIKIALGGFADAIGIEFADDMLRFSKVVEGADWDGLAKHIRASFGDDIRILMAVAKGVLYLKRRNDQISEDIKKKHDLKEEKWESQKSESEKRRAIADPIVEAYRQVLSQKNAAQGGTQGGGIGQYRKHVGQEETSESSRRYNTKDLTKSVENDDGKPYSNVAGVASSEYVRERQKEVAGIRKGALKDRLRAQLEYGAKRHGLIVDVTSGGQRMEGARGWTGSHRHDGGGAADFRLRDKETGRVVSPNDPRALGFAEDVAAAGATGAGEGYMRGDKNLIHMGGGPGKVGAYLGSNKFKQAWQRGLRRQKDFAREQQEKADSAKPKNDKSSSLERRNDAIRMASGEDSMHEPKASLKILLRTRRGSGLAASAEVDGMFKDYSINRQQV